VENPGESVEKQRWLWINQRFSALYGAGEAAVRGQQKGKPLNVGARSGGGRTVFHSQARGCFDCAASVVV